MGTMIYAYHNALSDKITTAACYGLDNPKAKYHWQCVNSIMLPI